MTQQAREEAVCISAPRNTDGFYADCRGTADRRLVRIMWMDVNIYMYIYVYVYVCICVIYIYIYIYTCPYIYIYIHTYICAYTNVIVWIFLMYGTALHCMVLLNIHCLALGCLVAVCIILYCTALQYIVPCCTSSHTPETPISLN